MSTGKAQFLKKYGVDPLVKIYIDQQTEIDEGVYTKMCYYDKNKKIIYWMLFPYRNNRWTDDKITFRKFEQLTNFAKKLNFKLFKG